jgi:hypothetical protein
MLLVADEFLHRNLTDEDFTEPLKNDRQKANYWVVPLKRAN